MTRLKVIGIIPARMASTRFPGKPLAPILGLPMIEHVRRRASLAASMDEVVVASCDQEVLDVVRSAGGQAVPTSPTHERCTDRVAEAARRFKAEIVVNVQGDEPCLLPPMIEAAIEPLRSDPAVVCVNLMTPLTREEDWMSPNTVKVVVNLKSDALYFSREPIPSRAKAPDGASPVYRQVCILAFRSEFLQQFAQLPPTPLERIESVDMMRVLEHGYAVRMVPVSGEMVSVDVPEDLARAERWLASDPLVERYLMSAPRRKE